VRGSKIRCEVSSKEKKEEKKRTIAPQTKRLERETTTQGCKSDDRAGKPNTSKKKNTSTPQRRMWGGWSQGRIVGFATVRFLIE